MRLPQVTQFALASQPDLHWPRLPLTEEEALPIVHQALAGHNGIAPAPAAMPSPDSAEPLIRLADVRDTFPRFLARGDKQKLCIAAIVAMRPQVLLLDEPTTGQGLPLDYALMIVLALNFVPIVLAEFGRIADAQKARAHALIERGPIGRARGLVPIFVPLTLNAVDRADTVGKVLEIRGFARRQFRLDFEPLSRGSWALLAVSIVLLGLALASAALGQDLIALLA